MNNLLNQVMQMVNSGGNPNNIAMNMLNTNPQARQLMEQYKTISNGLPPKQFAMQLAKQNGVDINQVMQFANRLGLK